MNTTKLPLLVCTVLLLASQTIAQREIALYPIPDNGKFGYIDENGRVVIKPQFDDAKLFSEGLARVRIKEKWGFIDPSGKLVITPNFELTSNNEEANDRSLDFHEGRAAVCFAKDSAGRLPKWGYIDQSGKLVVPAKYDHAERFSEGLALVTDDYSKTKGNETTIYIGGAGKYIDRDGNVVSLTVVGETFAEGLAIAFLERTERTDEDNQKEPKVGFIDKTGRFRIAPRFWVPYAFSEGLARVRAGDRDEWGYIDHTGRLVIKMKYENAGDFHEGLARVTLGTVSFINKFGVIAMRHAFPMVGNFSGGLASACVESASAFHFTCGYVDKRGEWAIKPTFAPLFLGDFRGKLAWVCNDEKCGYVNRAGHFVWALRNDWKSKEPLFPSPMTGCSIMSDKGDRNYPCTLEFKLF
jgi:hypothetical protein